MFFIVPTDKPIDVTCRKCGKKFTQYETRTCTSLNNFIHICPKCKIKSIFPFGKNNNQNSGKDFDEDFDSVLANDDSNDNSYND